MENGVVKKEWTEAIVKSFVLSLAWFSFLPNNAKIKNFLTGVQRSTHFASTWAYWRFWNRFIKFLVLNFFSKQEFQSILFILMVHFSIWSDVIFLRFYKIKIMCTFDSSFSFHFRFLVRWVAHWLMANVSVVLAKRAATLAKKDTTSIMYRILQSVMI